MMRLLLAPFAALLAFVRRLWTRWTWERFLDGLRKTDDERVYPEPCRVCHMAGAHKLQCPNRDGQGLRIPARLYAIPSDETTQRSARDVAPVTEGEALDWVERRKL